MERFQKKISVRRNKAVPGRLRKDRREANRAVAVSAIGLTATGLVELLLAALTGSVGRWPTCSRRRAASPGLLGTVTTDSFASLKEVAALSLARPRTYRRETPKCVHLWLPEWAWLLPLSSPPAA